MMDHCHDTQSIVSFVWDEPRLSLQQPEVVEEEEEEDP